MTEKILDEYITVSLLGSGYAAVHMVLVHNEDDEYWDVQQTGIGRYKYREDAEIEARIWARNEEIRLYNV